MLFYHAKVRIFQQITTGTDRHRHQTRCCFTMQRYEFFSKSQQTVGHRGFYKDVVLPCKGTNFSANHNYSVLNVFAICDVVLPCKGTNFSANHNSLRSLFVGSPDVVLPCKGTNFSANHNEISYSLACRYDVVLPCKGTNFSANHN